MNTGIYPEWIIQAIYVLMMQKIFKKFGNKKNLGRIGAKV
jgi:hypothetical protein